MQEDAGPNLDDEYAMANDRLMRGGSKDMKKPDKSALTITTILLVLAIPLVSRKPTRNGHRSQ